MNNIEKIKKYIEKEIIYLNYEKEWYRYDKDKTRKIDTKIDRLLNLTNKDIDIINQKTKGIKDSEVFKDALFDLCYKVVK